MSESETKKYKVVFLGKESVGKSSILNRFVYDTFESNYEVFFVWVDMQATLGIDYVSKRMYTNNKTIQLQL